MSTIGDTSSAKKLFGEPTLRPYIGGVKPEPGDLLTLGQKPDPAFGKFNAFCSGCGMLDVMTEAGEEDICQRAGVPVPADWTGKYIEFERCDACTAGVNYVRPSLHEIKSS